MRVMGTRYLSLLLLSRFKRIYVQARKIRDGLAARRLPLEQQIGINLLPSERSDIFHCPRPIRTRHLPRPIAPTDPHFAMHNPLHPPPEERLRNHPRINPFPVAQMEEPRSQHAFALQHGQEFVDDCDVVLGDVVQPAVCGERVVEVVDVPGVGFEDGRGLAEVVAQEDVVVEGGPGEVDVDGGGDVCVDVRAHWG